MLTINNAQTPTGKITNLTYPAASSQTIDAANLTILPGLIDPHVHFRTPGMEHKEDWRTGAKAAIAGGYTTVFDMPNTIPPTNTEELLKEKHDLINSQLKEVGIPLRYQLFFGADKHHFSEIHKIKNSVIGIKVFMGCSTGNLVMDDDESLHALFAIAATQNLLVAVHAEDETRLHQRKQQFANSKNYADHSCIRDVEAACIAVSKAISLARIYKTRLYILHVSTAEEIALIRAAKNEGLAVYAETTPHHLFLNDQAYASLQGRAVVNPPLRAANHNSVLFTAIREGIIDTIGSDHAPHTLSEKTKPYGECPSGMPGIETTLPLLLTAYHNELLSLDNVLDLTVNRAREIFNVPVNDDVVLVDMNLSREVRGELLQTKCGWSAFEDMVLKGWPLYTIVNNHLVCSPYEAQRNAGTPA